MSTRMQRIKENAEAFYQEHGEHYFIGSSLHCSDATIRMVFLGIHSIFITDGATTLFIDPALSRPKIALSSFLSSSFPTDANIVRQCLHDIRCDRVDAVLYSHSHIDHTMDMGVFDEVVCELSGTYPVNYGSYSTAMIGYGAGIKKEHFVQIGTKINPFANGTERFAIGDFVIEFSEGTHLALPGPLTTAISGYITDVVPQQSRADAYKEGGTYNMLLIHKNGKSIFFQSSFNSPANQLDSSLKADVLIMGAGGCDLAKKMKGIQYWDTYYEKVVRPIQPKMILLSHWEDFLSPLDEKIDWNASCAATNPSLIDYFKEKGEIDDIYFLKLYEDIFL